MLSCNKFGFGFEVADEPRLLVTMWIDPKRIQLFFEYLFKCNIYKEGTVCQCENVSVCSAVVNNGLDSCWSLYIGRALWPTKYWKNTTACLRHKPQTGCHKTVRKLLNKHLLKATFENSKSYSVRFKYWPHLSASDSFSTLALYKFIYLFTYLHFDSIGFKMKKNIRTRLGFMQLSGWQEGHPMIFSLACHIWQVFSSQDQKKSGLYLTKNRHCWHNGNSIMKFSHCNIVSSK